MNKILSLGSRGLFLLVTALLMVSLLGSVTNAYASVTLNWTAPTTNTDGTLLTDLAGCNIYYGTSSGNYTAEINVGNVTTYTFTNLAAGTYYFAVAAYDTSGNQSVYSNEVVQTVGASISGTVTSTTGMGIANVYVEVDNSSGNYIASGWTASDGTYTVSGIPTGSYTINFSTYGSNYLRQWYNNETSSDSANLVSVTAPNTTSGVNAVLAVGGSISGIVTNAAGMGISNVYVEMDDGSGNYAAEGVTASDGTYTFSGIPTGSYTVNFSPDGSNYLVQWYNDESSSDSADVVSVNAPNATSGVNAVLAVGGSISGIVTNAAGMGISSVTVEIDDDSGNYIASAVTASDGTYTVSWIPSGSYTVNFIPADGANYLLQWYNNETSLGSANLVSVN
ncbi:MAG: carboxypeptidase regulatory-like domain-containing protein, partial [Dissulfurispiraceae bacterium]